VGSIDKTLTLNRKLMDSAADLSPPSVRPETAEADPRYFNRELSWLAFNRRVLEEACNSKHPLLERLRFLSISANNLDEFFMVRVAGLKAHQVLGVEERSADGLTPGQQLSAINLEADALVTSQHGVLAALQAALDDVGMQIVGDAALDEAAETWLDAHFREQIFPVLTPQAIDPAHPFPFIPNKGLSLIFELRKGKSSVRELVMAPVTLSRNIWWCTAARSGSCATATSRSRKRPRIWSVTSAPRSNAGGADGSSGSSSSPECMKR
jgi:polyphosphate kinase